MKPILSVTVTGDEKFVAWAKGLSSAISKALFLKMRALVLRLEAHVKQHKLSGQVLRVRTGALRSSIFNRVEEKGTMVIGRVIAPRDVPYAAIHEFGGRINHPGGTAYFVPMGNNGRAVFVSNSKAAEIESRLRNPLPRTRPHEIVMPVRSFLRSGLSDMRPVIERELSDTVIDIIKRGP